MNILITGAAGFIGSSLLKKLAERGDKVVGVDNLNNYYDPRLKLARLAECKASADFEFLCLDIADRDAMESLFDSHHFDVVVNLAAQAGVRYSIEKPYAYQHSNLDGFLCILEQCRHHGIQHLIFASSSSVYGQDSKVPFREQDTVNSPVSLYAATKKTDELMAYTYSHLYGLRTTGLRYFTVYGPWGRPDMAPMLFAKAIMKGEEIKVFNNGDMTRDFTYIDDIVAGTMHVIDSTNKPYKHQYRIYNIGCGHPVKLMNFIGELEQALGRKAKMKFLPMQPGDVYITYADTTRLQQEMGYKPSISLHEGIGRFAEWYLSDKNPLR